MGYSVKHKDLFQPNQVPELLIKAQCMNLTQIHSSQKGRGAGEAGARSGQPRVPAHRRPQQVRGASHLLQQPEDLHPQAEVERGAGGGGQPRLMNMLMRRERLLQCVLLYSLQQHGIAQMSEKADSFSTLNNLVYLLSHLDMCFGNMRYNIIIY